MDLHWSEPGPLLLKQSAEAYDWYANIFSAIKKVYNMRRMTEDGPSYRILIQQRPYEHKMTKCE